MKIFKLLDQIKEEYKDDCVVRKNETLICRFRKMPKCRHMFYKPLTDELIKEWLVDECKLTMPKQYLEFLKYSNGISLFGAKTIYMGYTMAVTLLVIYALPRTAPFTRPFDEEEPFDIRVEDLRRHKNISKRWLKCGNWYKDCYFDTRLTIFIDTDTQRVYSSEEDSDKIVQEWDSFDECLCDLIETLKDSPFEIN